MELISKSQEKQAMLVAKAIAILAVVVLHVLALFPDSIYTTSQYSSFFIFINQLSRFSVPLFLALSGFGLARKFQKKSVQKKKFLWNRVIKLLPLYFLWSIILFVILYFSNTWSSGAETGILESLLLGNTDYHLYFVPLIFQFYLLFSILLSKIGSRNQLFLLVVLSGILQVIWFMIIRYISQSEMPDIAVFLNDQIQYRLVISWLFYFLVGIFLAHLNVARWRSSRKLGWLLLTTAGIGLSWSIYDSSMLVEQTGQIIYATSFIRVPVLLYASSVIAGVILFGPLVQVRLGLRRILGSIGKYSYVIYLSHTLLLRIIDGVITSGPRAITLTHASILFIIGVFVSVVQMR